MAAACRASSRAPRPRRDTPPRAAASARRAPRCARSPCARSSSSCRSASRLRDDVVERRPVLLLQTLEQREPVFDLLEPLRRGVDAGGVRAEEEREVLELRLDDVAGVEVRREAASIAASSPSRFQTIAERRKGRLVAFVQCVVRLGAEPLQPVGVRQHLARRRELVVFARLPARRARSPPAGRSGTRRATRSRAHSASSRSRSALSVSPASRTPSATAARSAVDARRTRRGGRGGSPGRAGPGARAGRAGRPGRRTARAAPRWSRARRRRTRGCGPAPRSRAGAITSRPSGVSKMASTAAVSSPVRTRSAEARPPTSRPTAPTRMDLPAPVSPVRTFRPGSNSSSRRSMTARLRMERKRSMNGQVPSYQMFDSENQGVLRFVEPALSQRRSNLLRRAVCTCLSTPLRVLRKRRSRRLGPAS